jgi:maleylpyruvate isomerase
MILHGYWRSGTSYRTRIALNLKGLSYEQRGIDLRRGDQAGEAFRSLNAQGLVPALEVRGQVITQSPAIIEWLEECYPDPPLLPRDALERAKVRALASIIGCDIHPLNNLRVLKALKTDFGADQAALDDWAARWIRPGFEVLNAHVHERGTRFAHEDQPGLIDCYLLPQIYSARRFNMDLSAYAALLRVEENASAHKAFIDAHPDNQPDAD